MTHHTNNIPDKFKHTLFESDYESYVNTIIEFEGKTFSDDELMPLIRQTNNKDIRCWALLKINYILNAGDAEFIINALQDSDSRLRELSSELIYRHICEYKEDYKNLFILPEFYDYYIRTTTDINPRVTRNITACYRYFKNKNLLFDKLIFALKNYEGPFVQYWALEGIVQIIKELETTKVKEHSEYLINLFNNIINGQEDLSKEKVAIILPDFLQHVDITGNRRFNNNLNKLKNNKNFFIKQVSKNINYKQGE